MSDLLIIQAGLDTVALVRLTGLKGDLPVPTMKKHMALSLIRSRLWDPLDGPKLRALANEVSGGMMNGPVSDDYMMAAFDRAMSPPESLIAVPVLSTPPQFLPYDGPSIGPMPRRPQPPRKVVDQAVLRMSMEDRFSAALAITKDKLGPAFAAQIDGLLTPENLAIMGTMLAIWAAGHFFGVSEFADAVLLIAGIAMVGMAAIDVAEKLVRALELISGAQNRDDLREAGLLFADIVAIIGVQALLALLLWMAGKAGAKAKGRGKAPPDPPPEPNPLPPEPQPPKLLPRLARGPVEKLADGVRDLPNRGPTMEAARPSDVSRMVTKDGREFPGRSKFADKNLHPDLQKALDEIPVDQRAPATQHGRCAEINAIDKAMKSGQSVEGSAIQTAKVRRPPNADHGKPHAPCPSCAQVLKKLGVTYVD